MTYNSLPDFIGRLEAEQELVRIKYPVSPVLEITEIADRMIKRGGKALLFENVKGYNVPVLINAYGSTKRMCLSLGVANIQEISDDIQRFINLAPPKSWQDKFSLLSRLFEFTKFPPKRFKGAAPCQEIVLTGDQIDLGKIPILQCWPHDGGRFITFPAVFTKSLKTGKRNVGMYRMQVYDKNTTGMHWHIHKDGAANYHEYQEAGVKMPVAVAIGTDPAVTYVATAPLPPGIDELLLAGFIRKKNVELVKCKTIDLEVPATAEYVLEGYVDLAESRTEGPFGDHTGYYSAAAMFPVFHLTAITSRKNPVYFTTIVGKPPMEDCDMARATSTIFLPLLKTQHPEIMDMCLPEEGTFHNCAMFAIKKRYPYQARKLMNALWGTGQMSFSKMLLFVDHDIDIHNHKQLVRYLLNNIDLEQDLFFTEGVLDVLDHSAPQPLYGSKLGLDLTRRLPGEFKPRRIKSGNPELPALESLLKGIDCVANANLPFPDTGLKPLLVAINKTHPYHAKEVAEMIWQNDVHNCIDIILVLDGNIDTKDLSYVAWRMFNNVNPNRDITYRPDGRVIIDVTKKSRQEGYPKDWPEELRMDKEVIGRIDSVWKDLGLD
ncbi:MAG: menaquinone biosynthesis decarboxylase [Candidatus Schekmanbacteria bacterium]|nr:menaquinone biosynthesis decarboxylase [Candidatus Schekmanbacteria bacterium]